MRTAILVLALACEKQVDDVGVQEAAWQEAQQRFDDALRDWDLARAEAILTELETAGAPRANLDHDRSELASRLLLPHVYEAAPVETQRTIIELFPTLPLGATDVGCGASWGDQSIRSVDAPRALALYRLTERAADELQAAYVAGDLDAFEAAWRRLDASQRTVDLQARRARLLAKHDRHEAAIAQAREILAKPDAGADRLCGAELLIAKIEEAQGAIDAARESYGRAQSHARFGQCRTTVEARLATLHGIAPAVEIPRNDVRVRVQPLADAQLRVVLKAHHPSSGQVNLHGWMGDDDPSSWHNADMHVAIVGRNDAGQGWEFEGVAPGWYSIVVIVDGHAAARPADGTCIAGVYVQGGSAEVGPIDLNWQ